MLSSIASFSGLASGIQWRDLIDQIMAVEAAPIDRLQDRIDHVRSRPIGQLANADDMVENQALFADRDGEAHCCSLDDGAAGL